jgi:hypothetical protein
MRSLQGLQDRDRATRDTRQGAAAAAREYGIGEEQQATLAGIADLHGAHAWGAKYADVLADAGRDYLLLEAGASRISVYETQRIPPLLQTPQYARALAEAERGFADDKLDRAVKATLAWQKAILGERKPDIHVIIGEAALCQEVGGRRVMEGQLGLLTGVAATAA